jgi:hypothetical protein
MPSRHIQGYVAIATILKFCSLPIFITLLSALLTLIIDFETLRTQGESLGQQSRCQSADDPDNRNYESYDLSTHGASFSITMISARENRREVSSTQPVEKDCA